MVVVYSPLSSGQPYKIFKFRAISGAGLAKGAGLGERQGIARKVVRAIQAEQLKLKVAKVQQKPVFAALLDCQQISGNPHVYDTLGLAEG